MNKVSVILALAFTGVLVGCASGPAEDGGEVNRDAMAQEILKGFGDAGINPEGERVSIAPGVDQALNVTNGIARRQRDTIEDYAAQRENFLDLKKFEEAHGPIGSDAFMTAVENFDAGDPEELMMPKVVAYANAQSGVYEANTTLAVELVSAAAEIATLVSQNSDVVAEAAAGGMLGSLMGGDSDPNSDLGAAIVRAQDQIKYSQQASELIKTEKATMDAILDLQADLDT